MTVLMIAKFCQALLLDVVDFSLNLCSVTSGNHLTRNLFLFSSNPNFSVIW